MRSILLVTAVATLGFLATAAHADETPGLYRKDRLELSVGENLGGFSVGPLSGFTFGGTVQARHGFGPVHLTLEGGFYGLSMRKNLSDETAYGGKLTRVGAAAELHFARFGSKSIGADLYVSGGFGRQMIWWNQGGKLTRPDVSMGLGIRALFGIGGSDEKPRVITVDMGVRGLVADAPDLGAGERCSAICDEVSGPYPYDLGIFWAMSVGYGW